MQNYKMKKLHHFFLINIFKNEHKETVKVKKIVQRVALYKQGLSYTFSGAKLAIILVLLVVTIILIRGHVKMENEIVPTRPRSDLSKISYPECN